MRFKLDFHKILDRSFDPEARSQLKPCREDDYGSSIHILITGSSASSPSRRFWKILEERVVSKSPFNRRRRKSEACTPPRCKKRAPWLFVSLGLRGLGFIKGLRSVTRQIKPLSQQIATLATLPGKQKP